MDKEGNYYTALHNGRNNTKHSMYKLFGRMIVFSLEFFYIIRPFSYLVNQHFRNGTEERSELKVH